MSTMPMGGGGMTAMAWMPMCGQSWIAAAASFVAMWTMMMAAMMLPSLAPVLWRYRRAVGRMHATRLALLMALVGAGYFLVWSLLGTVVFPLGAATAAATVHHPALARAAPAVIALVVLAAGALQLSNWKARHLACCRASCHEALGHGGTLPADAFGAWRHGLRLGLHCTQCCASLTVILIVVGIMDLPAMLAVTAGITAERLAPAGQRVARAIGIVTIGAGVLLTVRAVRLA